MFHSPLWQLDTPQLYILHPTAHHRWYSIASVVTGLFHSLLLPSMLIWTVIYPLGIYVDSRLWYGVHSFLVPLMDTGFLFKCVEFVGAVTD